jgi:ribose/xylose/arabinose/galactoside ABC-type transport system permease subunit
MSDLGRLLIALGLLLVMAGAVVLLLGRVGLPLGRLPGDLTWRGKHTTVYFPLGTSILVSVVLSIVFWLLSRWRR